MVCLVCCKLHGVRVQVLSRLAEFFDEDELRWGVLIVTWSGHGVVGTGNWALKDGAVSLDDVLRHVDLPRAVGSTLSDCEYPIPLEPHGRLSLRPAAPSSTVQYSHSILSRSVTYSPAAQLHASLTAAAQSVPLQAPHCAATPAAGKAVSATARCDQR